MRRKVIYADPSFFPGYRAPRFPGLLERLRVWGPLLAISAAVVAGALLGRSRMPQLPPAATTVQAPAPAIDVERTPPARPMMRVQGEPMVITVTVPARKVPAEQPAAP
jgi:hypothetical protein